MGAEADALCGAPYGERSPERVNIRKTATAGRHGTRASARSSSRSRSSDRGRTSGYERLFRFLATGTSTLAQATNASRKTLTLV